MIEYNKINWYIEDIIINKYCTDVENTFGYTVYQYNVQKTMHFKYNGELYTILFDYVELIKDINVIIVYLSNGDWVGFRVNQSAVIFYNDDDRW